MGLLKKNVELENGLVVDEVYYNIASYRGDKEIVTYSINAYANRESFVEGKPTLFEKTYTFPLADNLISSGYEQLKSTHEFSDAIDVFEDGQPK